jgi:transposase
LGSARLKDAELEGEVLVVRVAAIRRRGSRCGRCGRVCSGYDAPRAPRRWRALDLGTTRVFIEAEVVRVSCPEHGVVVERVPWAAHGSGFTFAFEEQAAWLAVECSKTAVAALMRIAWRTVGRILERVASRLLKPRRQLAGLRRLGIDEISFRKGQRYLTVVVDHDSGRLVWAAEGRDEKTLNRFFAALGRRRCLRITHVSADGAWWISKAVRAHCPNAVIGLDPFHVVAWATKALDEVRREVWNDARRAGDHLHARQLNALAGHSGRTPRT